MGIERWKDIPGYEGKYIISNKGRVMSLPFERRNGTNGSYLNKEKVLTPQENNTGYYRVCLLKNKKRSHLYIHRLVAENFIKNYKNSPCVNHIDGNKLNNNVENLEWVSYSENSSHAYHVLKNNDCKSQLNCFGDLNKNSKPVIQLNLNGEFVKRWECLRQIDRETDFCRVSVANCCKGKHEAYKGFKWVFEHDTHIFQHRSETPVNKLSPDKKFLKSYKTVSEAEFDSGVGHRNIRNSCDVGHKAGGFYWEYATT